MARVWLHIGMMKTGTTAMQEWCRNQAPALLAAGLLYVHAPRRAASGHLVKALSGPQPGQGDAIAALARQLAAAPAPDVLVSAESLAVRGPGFTRPLVAALAGHDLRILIWLRRQDRYAEALYKQVVKWRGGGPDPASFLRGLAAQLDYAALLDQWQAAFPQAQLLPQVYEEPEAGAPTDSIAAMLGALGRPDLIPADSATIRRNRTPHAGLVARYHQAAPDEAEIMRRLNRQIMREFGEAAGGRDDLIPPEVAQALRTGHAASNAATCARWFPGRAALFADPLPASAPAADSAAASAAGPEAPLRRLEALLAAARGGAPAAEP